MLGQTSAVSFPQQNKVYINIPPQTPF